MLVPYDKGVETDSLSIVANRVRIRLVLFPAGCECSIVWIAAINPTIVALTWFGTFDGISTRPEDVPLTVDALYLNCNTGCLGINDATHEIEDRPAPIFHRGSGCRDN